MTSFCDEDLDDGLERVVVLAGELDGLGAFELDLGLRVLEVEAGVDLFGGLVDCVLDFLKFHFADDVEAVIGCHGCLILSRSVRCPLCQERVVWEQACGSWRW